MREAWNAFSVINWCEVSQLDRILKAEMTNINIWPSYRIDNKSIDSNGKVIRVLK